MATDVVNNPSFGEFFGQRKLLVIISVEMFIRRSCGRQVEPRAAPSLCDGLRPELIGG